MTNPVALITGASGGLGVPVTEMSLGAGFRVTAVNRQWPAILAAASDPAVLRLEADATTASGAALAVQSTLARFGQLNALIHLVGAFAGGDGVAETTPETWLRMM
ncbi:MAG: SDR family NAD(P)-dependent oxidoreductase [Acidobacteria bacterium]|nr:SDR family NAD(P)-dependent oxidoreductase [Acidobacteriota bacterium]